MNAEKKLAATEGERWTITLDEVKAYLGVVLITNSLLTTPRNERYFIADENKWIFYTIICKVFSKNRFRNPKIYPFLRPKYSCNKQLFVQGQASY